MRSSDPFWEDFTWVEFIGGPLDCQIKKMEVYVGHIPVDHSINSYYQNVNAATYNESLHPMTRVRYKYFVDGKETL